MEAPNPNKRPRRVPPPSGQTPNPSTLPSAPDSDQKHVDLVIYSLLSLPELPSLSSSLSIGFSFDRAFDKLLASSSSGYEPVQDRLSDRALQLVSLLHDSTKRYSRKLATLRNSDSWALPPELTIKVFSMLDTKSLMRASACCTMFKKCAMDPLCYSHIDLTARNVRNSSVRSMLLKSGKELKSLEVGSPRSFLSGSCLDALSYNYCALGHRLRSLHLYNHRWLDNKSLCRALKACSNLTDVKITGLNVNTIEEVLSLLTTKCQHLFLEKEIGSGRTSFMSGTPFERYCPNLTSLSFIGFDIDNERAYHLVVGLPKLKYLNLSKTSGFAGGFLSDVSYDCQGSPLETLIMRDCSSLKERTVWRFLDSLLMFRDHFSVIRHIDVSNDRGLKYCGRRFSLAKFPLKELKEERPGLTFVATFRSSPPPPSPSSSSSSSSSSGSSSSSSSSYDSSSSSSEDTSSGSGTEDDDCYSN